jgi:dipeptidyl aminopeptidase/acylaminoacyl peptidase
VNYISAGLPPILIIHGSKDEIVPVESADDFVKKLKQAGNEDITYLKIEDGNHGVAYEFNLDLTRPAMDAFFERTLKK